MVSVSRSSRSADRSTYRLMEYNVRIRVTPDVSPYPLGGWRVEPVTTYSSCEELLWFATNFHAIGAAFP